MKTSNHNQDTLMIIMLKLSIFFLLCIAIVNAPHVKGQTIPSQVPIIHAKQHEVRQIYSSQIGIREKQANRGAEVEKYLRYVNLPKGNPWCAAFVCWVFGQAGIENPRSGWSPDLFKPNRIIWERSNIGALDKSKFPRVALNAYPRPLNYQPIRPARQQTTDN